MLTHINELNQPQMVDISSKNITQRTAIASGTVFLGNEIMQELTRGEIASKKGPVFATAIIAANFAIKKTHELIPFCHPISLENIKIEITPLDRERVQIISTVSCMGKTGVEMEALTGVHIAALTIHDMCKSMSPHILVENIGLVEKSGGKSDFKRQS